MQQCVVDVACGKFASRACSLCQATTDQPFSSLVQGWHAVSRRQPHLTPPPCSSPAGFVRYWLSAGRGGFGLSGNECLGSAFYCIVYTHEVPDDKLDGEWPLKGGSILV